MDQRRLLIATLLSVAVVVVYNELVVRPRQQPQETPAATAPAVPSPSAVPVPATAPATAGGGTGYLSFEPGAREVVVDTPQFRATLTPIGGRLTSFALKEFRRGVEKESPPLDLVERGSVLPLTLLLGPAESDAGLAYAASATALNVENGTSAELVLTGTTSSGLKIEKRLRFTGGSYLFDVDVSLAAGSEGRSIGLLIPRIGRDGTTAGARETALALVDGKIVEKDVTGVGEGGREPPKLESHPNAAWVGFGVPYFVGVAVDPDAPNAVASIGAVGSTPIVRLDVPPSGGKVGFKVFMGPKVREVLAAAGYGLDRTLDFGWFWFIALPMLWALRQLHRVTSNYGVDIILLTAIVRAGTIPLTQKSFRSMREMQRLQPQLKRLQELHKDDQTKLQQEMMELYRRHNVNPFSGCAPMVLQIPIFVGLYNALLHAIELRHAPFALWITDLSAPERLAFMGLGIPVLTIIMGGTMILQQWLTPQQGDPTQRQMMMVMPVVFTFMFINFPSGLVLYWLISNILGIAQQYTMLRSTPAT